MPEASIVYRGTSSALVAGSRHSIALFDAFAKVVLTCVPEPPPDARRQAIARAKERYGRLVKSAGQNMSGDARDAMRDLVSHATN